MKHFNFPSKAILRAKWDYLQYCCTHNIPVVGYISKYSDYLGFTVEVDEIIGSMNKYDYSFCYTEDFNKCVGRYVLLSVVRVNPVTHELKLSRKRLASKFQKGDIVQGFIEDVREGRLKVDAGFKVRLTLNHLPYIEGRNLGNKYKIGDSIEFVLLEDVHKEIYTNAIAKPAAIWEANTKNLSEGDILKASVDSIVENGIKVYLSEFFSTIIHYNFLSSEYKKFFDKEMISVGEQIQVVITKIDNEKRNLLLSQKHVEAIIQREAEQLLITQLEPGFVVEAEVIDVNAKEAILNITGTKVKYKMDRDDLSPNKVINASDEVFVGQILQIVYEGETDGKIHFSRKYLVDDVYDEELYDLSLNDLLAKMNIGTTRFIGKAIKIKDKYFFTNIISIAENATEDNGKLLINPVTGKSLIVVLNDSLFGNVEENKFYEFRIDVANKRYRKKSGTPFMFCVNSSELKEVRDPYHDAVSLSFTKHRSPSSSTSLAYLLNEVGQNLYSSKKRMFFELIQNADDAASLSGVQIKLQICGDYFVITHNGYAFSKPDFDSITSAAKSTKGSNKKKTGYKGIGFKSVFTNSDTVQIKSGGFNFLFDKGLSIYNDFKKFYFFVNDIENDPSEQEKFLYTYEKEFREFKDVRDIPWQLLPVWAKNDCIEGDSIFNGNENVAIALKMADENLSQYKEAIEEIFREPRFMLFLRNTKRIQLIQDGICKTIQKTNSLHSNIITLSNSFNIKNRVENYNIFSSGEIIVDDNAFSIAGIPIRRTERSNSRGEKENFLVNLDEDGNMLKTTIDVPDRIASSSETSISIALRLDKDNNIIPIDKDDISLYAYLPMNETRYRFPFYINADFIPKSDREGIQTDNPWNHFLFYQIGRNIVRMVSEIASESQPKYLNLLLSKSMDSDTHDTKLLSDAFNRGYKEGLMEYDYIIDDEGNKVKADNIIYDKSGLSNFVGYDNFYKLIGTNKRLPNVNIDSYILTHEIFGVECIKKETVVNILIENIDNLNEWLDSVSEEHRQNFYEWVSLNEECHDIIADIHVFKFEDCWRSINEISLQEKQIISKLVYVPILPILKDLGFKCSENIFEEHPLEEYLIEHIQKDVDVFSALYKTDPSLLDFEQRLLLFKTADNFNGVSDATLKSWSLFKNREGNYSELGNLLSYEDDAPCWLHKYMLCKEECCEDLEKYTIDVDDSYDSIIVPFIDDIIKDVDVYEIYLKYLIEWQSSLTINLIKKKVPNIISVVEQADFTTKSEYLNSISSLDINTSIEYKPSDELYRCIKIATSDDSLIPYIRGKVKINGILLSNFTIKDEFSITIGDSTFKFLLSNIVPDLESTSTLTKVIENFSSLPSIEKLFVLNEITNIVWVKDNLVKYLTAQNSPLLTAEQFAFLICYEKRYNKSYFESDISPYIKINDKSLFTQILQYCYDKDMGEILKFFITQSSVTYPYDRFVGTYFDCGDFALEEEKTPDFISSWADDEEKKKFLISLGLHDLRSDEMIRRQAFKNEEEKGTWTISNKFYIEQFLKWVKCSMQLPFSDDYHRSVLIPLMAKINCGKTYNEDELSSAYEWNDDRYKDWKSDKELRIYIYEGQIPYSCSWDNTVFYTGAEMDFIFFPDTNHLYINGLVDTASVLSNVYVVHGIPFDKDDWHQLFFISRDSILEYSNENEKLRNRVAELEDLVQQYRAAEHTGKEVTERGSVATIDQEAINREVRILAKPILKKNGYDVSNWDPITSPPDIIGLIKHPDGESINVVVRSAKGRKLHLAATSFEALMTNPKNLLIIRGEDGLIHTIDFKELFGENSNVNLIFDAKFTPLSYFQALGTIFKYVKNTDFVIENPHYSAFDEIKGFGLDIKNEGSVLIVTEENI